MADGGTKSSTINILFIHYSSNRCIVIDSNSLKGLESSLHSASSNLVSVEKSKLIDSRRILKQDPSSGCVKEGIIGGVWFLNSAQLVAFNSGCDLTSEAPARDPSRLFSSLTRSRFIKDLHWCEMVASG
jgi:hypothetical protein